MKAQESVLKRELARRDGLPEGVAAPEALDELPRETVLLIHGTFANEASSWWLPGSDFCRKLDAYLLMRKSPARCWVHITDQKDVFAWTGDNLESERRIGGDALAKQIAVLEAINDINRYHIVAHSHGGNVVLHALRSLAEAPKKLGAVIFLGTPVLCFSGLLSWLSRSVRAMLLYGGGLFLSIAVAVHSDESLSSVLVSEGSPLFAWFYTGKYPWFTLLAMGFGVLLLCEWMMRPRRMALTYGSGHAHAFEFVPDEAMKALQLSLAIAQRPGEALKQLYSTQAPPKYAVEPPRPKFWKGVWSDFKSTTTYRLFRDSGFPNSLRQAARSQGLVQRLACIFGIVVVATTAITTILTLPDSYFNVHYFQQERPPLVNYIAGLRSLSKTISNTSVSVVLGIAWLCLTILFLWRLLLIVLKITRLSLAWTAQLFLQGPGVRIMGLVVQNAAFGGQCKEVLSPHQLPENERARSEAISDELSQRMNDLSRNTAARAGEALYFALAEGDAMQLKKHILARLTDPKLVHCQYYREDEIISRIADLIADPLLESAKWGDLISHCARPKHSQRA